MKKLLCMVLLLALVFTCYGCTDKTPQTTSTTTGATTTSGKTETTPAETTPAETTEAEVFEFTAWTNSAPPTGLESVKQTDMKVGAALTAITKTSFNVSFTTGDGEQTFNLKLASGQWEEVLAIPKNFTWIDKLVKADAIIPLDDYFNDGSKYPNLAAIPENVLDSFRFTDGHIYYFPSGWYEDPNTQYGQFWCASGWYINPEYLQKVGMTTDSIATIEGMENFLQAVKDADIKTGEGLSVLPLSFGTNISIWQTILNTFGVSTAGKGFDIYDGQVMHYRDHPQTKEAFKWLNELWRKGLIDKEVVSHTNDQLVEKLLNKRVALVTDMAWSFWGSVTGGANNATQMTYAHFPKVSGVSKLGIGTTYGVNGGAGLVVTKNCKNPDGVARYAEWASQKGEYRDWNQYYGPRGLIWDWHPDKGEPYTIFIDQETIDALSTGDYAKLTELGVAFGRIWIGPSSLNGSLFQAPLGGGDNPIQWVIDMHFFNAEEGYTMQNRAFDEMIIPAEGAWATNSTTLTQLDTQYFSQMLTAKSEADFEKMWTEYGEQLEAQGNWSNVKEEWIATYNALD